MEKIQLKIPDKFYSKINEVEQEVIVGTWDNVLLALTIFALGIGITILVTGIVSPKISPSWLLVMLIAFLFVFFLLQAGLIFLDSIFFKERRFTNKSRFIALLISFCTLLILLFALPVILINILPYFEINKPEVYFPMLVLVYGIPILVYQITYPKIKRFFLKNCPNLILKKILVMSSENKKRLLKHWNTTLPELKKLAKEY